MLTVASFNLRSFLPRYFVRGSFNSFRKYSTFSDKAITSFDHICFWVGNAKQAASYYCTLFGFAPFAHADLTTGSRKVASYAVKQNQIVLVFQSTLEPDDQEIGQFLTRHGDAVKDLILKTDNLDTIVEGEHFLTNGTRSAIAKEEDSNGYLRYARINPYGDVFHTFVDRKNYRGPFWPGYVQSAQLNPVLSTLPETNLECIDHVVCNVEESKLNFVKQRFQKDLQFKTHWLVGDKECCTEHLSMKACVASNLDESVKLVMCAPTNGKRGKSQIEVTEFLNFNGGAGIQHIAFHSSDIVATVKALRYRGVEFVSIPDNYYVTLRTKLTKETDKTLISMLDKIEENKILVDYNENGYLFQTFTKPIQDRPTLFIEIIQRNNFKGFGDRNIRALFEAVESEQQTRGNL